MKRTKKLPTRQKRKTKKGGSQIHVAHPSRLAEEFAADHERLRLERIAQKAIADKGATDFNLPAKVGGRKTSRAEQMSGNGSGRKMSGSGSGRMREPEPTACSKSPPLGGDTRKGTREGTQHTARVSSQLA